METGLAFACLVAALGLYFFGRLANMDRGGIHPLFGTLAAVLAATGLYLLFRENFNVSITSKLP